MKLENMKQFRRGVINPAWNAVVKGWTLTNDQIGNVQSGVLKLLGEGEDNWSFDQYRLLEMARDASTSTAPKRALTQRLLSDLQDLLDAEIRRREAQGDRTQPFVVFYAWQSDRPDEINRKLIGDAIRIACERISADVRVEHRPVVDQDTEGVSGMPPIALTILSKIREASAVVCDLTLVNDGPGKRLPNPNVTFELGYAVGVHSWDAVIGVMNESFGGFRKLPFDLRGNRRPIAYELAAGAGEAPRLDAREALSRQLEEALRLVMTNAKEDQR